jgi:hypothetical protein
LSSLEDQWCNKHIVDDRIMVGSQLLPGRFPGFAEFAGLEPTDENGTAPQQCAREYQMSDRERDQNPGLYPGNQHRAAILKDEMRS